MKPRDRNLYRNSYSSITVTIFCSFLALIVLVVAFNIGSFFTTQTMIHNFFNSSKTNNISTTNTVFTANPDLIYSLVRSPSGFDDTFDVDDPDTTQSSDNYTLGPKITLWDEQRREWLAKHPEFPSYTTGNKPRVLLVTGSSPNPCEKQIGDYYILKALKNKMDYCRLNDIDIFYNTAHLDAELSGFWAKLPLIRKMLLSHPEVEWVWWVDSDAIFTDMAFEVPFGKYEAHNLVIHGWPKLIFEDRNWVGVNTGSFFLRNCQWTLDLLDAWVPMGPKGKVRKEAGKVLTAFLTGRPDFEADDQSAFMYLLLTEKDKWFDKIYIENTYYLHGYWIDLVDKYEEMMEKNHPGLGDERWPFVTHFVGCKPCGSKDADYPLEKCLKGMERALNFADNQVMRMYGFVHESLVSSDMKRVSEPSARP